MDHDGDPELGPAPPPSGEPAYRGLPAYFLDSFTPVLAQFLNTAAATGQTRADTSPDDLMRALSGIAAPDDHAYANRVITLLVDGLRNGPTASQ
ncbi:hypothetical protein OHA70_33430 [Kribbella sp. NBC_00382]|uniref:SbtR family transcriptional regulator n=1 Tax=Kribbella sp. NBC_00382 TaxID=2975967 RepID=UPI002E1B7B38